MRSKRQNQKCISPSLPSSQTELHSFHPNGAGGWGIWFVASSQHLMFAAAAAHPSHTLCLVHCRVPPMGYGPSKTVPVWVFFYSPSEKNCFSTGPPQAPGPAKVCELSMACSFLQGTSICSSVGPSTVWISAPALSSLDCSDRSFL